MAADTRTGGRSATNGQIDGRYSLSVGRPEKPSPSGWKWKCLTDLARLETGHTPSRKHPEYWDGDVPWIGIKDATSNHGQTIADTYQRATQLGIDNSSARVLPANTVCLSRTASVGYVVVMGRPMATSQDFVNWVCGDELDYNFLKYILISEKDSFLRFASGTTHQTIYFPEVKAFHVCLPCLGEQKAIAHILGTLDDKIELNRKTNETLEAMAKALFKSWFVDFDPVKAKTEGRPTGLPPEISDLFPDSFEDSELGEIPSGWKISSLGEEFNWREGKPWNKEDRVERSAISVFGANGSIGFGSRQMGDSRVIFIGKIGSCGAINYHNGLFWATNNTHFISLEENPFLEYARQVLRVVDFSQYIGGSSNPYMPYGNFAHHQIPSPSSDLLRIFCDSVTPLRESIEQREEASKTLCALRNALLPKLISGEIRIPDAEKMLEEVGI